MEFLEYFKNQLAENVFVNPPIHRSSYFDAMLRTTLTSANQIPIIRPEHSKTLIQYCMDSDIQSVETKSYLSVLQYMYLNSSNNEIDNKIRVGSKQTREDYSTTLSVEEEITSGTHSDINKTKSLTTACGIKASVVKTQGILDGLANMQQSITSHLDSLEVSIGDVIGFKPESEYEFTIEDQKLYRILSNHVTINYGSKKTYNRCV